jgi:DNA-binding MarR family transcriptional regulator
VLASPTAALAAMTPTAQHPHYFTRAVSTVTLSADQKSRIAAITARYRAAHPDSAPHDQKAEDAFHQQITAVLTPAQRKQVQAALTKLRAAGNH